MRATLFPTSFVPRSSTHESDSFHAPVNNNLTVENHRMSVGRMWITTGSVRNLDLPATKLMSVLPCHRTLLAAVSSSSSHDTEVMMGGLGTPLSRRQQCWYRIRQLPSLQMEACSLKESTNSSCCSIFPRSQGGPRLGWKRGNSMHVETRSLAQLFVRSLSLCSLAFSLLLCAAVLSSASAPLLRWSKRQEPLGLLLHRCGSPQNQKRFRLSRPNRLFGPHPAHHDLITSSSHSFSAPLSPCLSTPAPHSWQPTQLGDHFPRAI